jgi:ATP-dependent DNA helicase PIF1
MQQLRAYVFQSACFKEAKFRVVELTKVFRQVDRAFIQLLAKIRIGCVDRETMQFFGGQAMRRELPLDNIKPTQLFCTNAKVDEINRDELLKLNGRVQVYHARDSFSYHAEATEAGSRRLRACELVSGSSQVASTLSLKVGAQVMLTKNMAEWGLVNGSRGVVVDFITAEEAIQRLERALLSPLAEEQLRYVEAAIARG